MSLEIIQSAFEDVKECVERAIEWPAEITETGDFTNSTHGMLVLDAVSMRLQVIGEMLKNIAKRDKEFLNRYPQIEWAEIIKLRDIISHHYREVNAEIVFNICKNDLPPLQKVVDKILNDINTQLKND
jgi:uncharacterized protein with HEPN domain